MNLSGFLSHRAAEGRPIRVGVIGCGKFATMFLAQARHTPGLHVLGVCDLDRERSRQALERAGWTPDQLAASALEQALERGTTYLSANAEEVIEAPGMDVIVEATGDPEAGTAHALASIKAGRHIVMVTVEADVLVGPLLARRAREAGVVYSMAYGDQPALIAEQVDWARCCGLKVVCAGKGTKYLPTYHASTPETVWEHYGLSPERAARAGMNPKMFNSFLDGTKSAIEMAAVANATGLAVPAGGLLFPPCDVRALPQILKPREAGGILEHSGTVEVVSSLQRDGGAIEQDLRWGVYVTFEAPSDYVRDCFSEYGLVVDDSGRYSALYRPHHLIGLELGVSVASAALRGEATGTPRRFAADVVATAKRALTPGEKLDGEGGFTVWGRLTTAEDSLGMGAVPIGLAADLRLSRSKQPGEAILWDDVVVERDSLALETRRVMEHSLRGRAGP